MQAAKAEALGPHYDTAVLDGIVAEPWASTVKADAAKAQRAGWFWKYKINSVKVQRSALCVICFRFLLVPLQLGHTVLQQSMLT